MMNKQEPLTKILTLVELTNSRLDKLSKNIRETNERIKPEFLTKSAIAKHRSLTGSGFEQSDRRFPQPTVCCQILS